MVAGGNFVLSLTAGLFFRYLLIQLRKGSNLRHIATLGLVAEAIDQGSLEQVVKPWNGENISPRPPSGTIDGVPNIQTPSRAEHGPRGRFIL